jgi:putative membrane protein
MFMPQHITSSYGYLVMILGGLSWLAIVAGIVLLAIWAVRALPRTALVGSARTPTESPQDILARRFASGEISAEEFQHARDLLRGDSSKP